MEESRTRAPCFNRVMILAASPLVMLETSLAILFNRFDTNMICESVAGARLHLADRRMLQIKHK